MSTFNLSENQRMLLDIISTWGDNKCSFVVLNRLFMGGHYYTNVIRNESRDDYLSRNEFKVVKSITPEELTFVYSRPHNLTPDNPEPVPTPDFTTSIHDPINNPSHYDLFADGTQSMDIIQKSLTPEEFKGFLKGNCLKYRLRAGKKDNLQQDIDKANWYANKLCEVCDG